jgi:hypothetical protein
MAKGETGKTPTPAREVDEWGLPDWQHAAAYGDTKKWGFYRWRWEFYRRRDDLRACFDMNAEASFNRWKRYFRSEIGTFQRTRWDFYADDLGGISQPPHPSEVGFVAFIQPEDVARFGYLRLPNPRISEQNLKVITPHEDDGTVSVAVGEYSETIQETLTLFRQPLTDFQILALKEKAFYVPVPIGKREIAVVFDLTKPLSPQLSAVKRNLTEEQKKMYGKPLQKRRRPEKWLSYLRTLDARDDGAAWSTIAALHPHTAQTEQTARDIWEAANALRFNF